MLPHGFVLSLDNVRLGRTQYNITTRFKAFQQHLAIHKFNYRNIKVTESMNLYILMYPTDGKHLTNI